MDYILKRDADRDFHTNLLPPLLFQALCHKYFCLMLENAGYIDKWVDIGEFRR